MRTRTLALLAVAIAALTTTVRSTHASFHFMQVEQVIGGVDGDCSIQAIQLRMRSNFQTNLAASRLAVVDAAGLNQVIISDPAGPVAVGGPGGRVLIATQEFVDASGLAADFLMTQIPACYLAAGSLVFTNNTGTIIYWRLSWGGAGYTGPTTGAITNDPDGDFGPPVAGALPSDGSDSYLFTGAATAQSTTNLADYALTASPTFANNAGSSAMITGFGSCPEDLDGDGVVAVTDLLALLAAWSTTPCCAPDFDGGGVAVTDLLQMLAAWGPC